MMDEYGLCSGVMFSLGVGKGMNYVIVSFSLLYVGWEWISDSVFG